MSENSATAKKSGPGRWILLGCGVLTGIVILGMGGCAGIFYFIYKGTEPVAEVGADYLRNTPQVSAVIHGKRTVQRHLMGWQVNVANDRGNARITYDLTGDAPDSAGVATVWLTRKAGAWSVVAARVDPMKGESITIGDPPKEHHRIDWD